MIICHSSGQQIFCLWIWNKKWPRRCDVYKKSIFKKTTFHMNIEKPAMYILWRVYCFPTPFDAGIIICPRKNSYFALTYRHRPKGEFQIGFPMQLKLVDMFVNILTAISEFDELTKTHLYLVNLLPGLVLSDS